MKILKKLTSKCGQLSIELGLIIVVVVLACGIVGYYYVVTSKNVAKIAGETANISAHNISKAVSKVVDEISPFVGK